MLKQLRDRKNYHWTSTLAIKNYGLIILLISFTSGCFSTHRSFLTQEQIQEKQVLEDNQLGVDGLGGARVAELTPDGQLLVVSGDDNSLAIFNVDGMMNATLKTLIHFYWKISIIDCLLDRKLFLEVKAVPVS